MSLLHTGGRKASWFAVIHFSTLTGSVIFQGDWAPRSEQSRAEMWLINIVATAGTENQSSVGEGLHLLLAMGERPSEHCALWDWDWDCSFVQGGRACISVFAGCIAVIDQSVRATSEDSIEKQYHYQYYHSIRLNLQWIEKTDWQTVFMYYLHVKRHNNNNFVPIKHLVNSPASRSLAASVSLSKTRIDWIFASEAKEYSRFSSYACVVAPVCDRFLCWLCHSHCSAPLWSQLLINVSL